MVDVSRKSKRIVLISHFSSKIKCESEEYAGRQSNNVVAPDVDICDNSLPSGSNSHTLTNRK